MAVGARFDSSKVSAYATLVESWNGTSWSVQNSPNPGSSFNWLEGVSCVSPVMCTAVGYAANSSGAYRTLIESWDGTSWSVVHSPNPGPANSQNYLNGVSCTSAVACTAVGYRYNGVFKTLIESWNGTSWSVVPSPNPSPGPNANDSLYRVSCTSATACMAVGNRHTSVYKTLVESWNGTSWSVVHTPNRGATSNILENISCLAATECLAAGVHYPQDPSIGRTLVESWNGTSWSLMPSPNPDSSGDVLVGLSCSSLTACTATGYRGSNGVYSTLIESWDGTSWSVVPSRNRGTISSALSGVSCLSATACTAVGNHYDHGGSSDIARTLIESGAAGPGISAPTR
jgi:hypothetical protein